MECLCAQTGPRFILSSERVLGNGVKGKIPSIGGSGQDRIRDAASRRTASLTRTLPVKLFQPPNFLTACVLA